MLDPSATQHIARLRAATTHRMDRSNLSKWVEKNTFMNGKNFSFKNHEFQERILNDPSQEIVIIKSAQLGISEMSLRMALALVMVMPDSFAVGYVFPTAGFATQYSKTRFNPIVQGSPLLRSSMNSEDLDSADVKTFGMGRQIYFKGASSGNSAISTSLDCCIFDELSFSDPAVIGDYTSRLIHSPHKIKIKLSTPTHPGDQIDSAYQASRRWKNFCHCVHCGEWFYPNYYDHVKIPGFDKHLDEINAENLHTIDYKNAKVMCPACVKPVNLNPEFRAWVCENPRQSYLATGYKLSPFDAPNVISVPYLVEASTSYASKSKFRQFNLGEPAADTESGLMDTDLDAIGIEGNGSPFTVHTMGIDLGLICHFTVGGMGSDQKLGVVHYERVPLAKFRERYWALKSQYRVSVVVSDQQPFVDLILSLSAEDANLFGAMYVTRQGLELFDVKVQEADQMEARGTIRQVHVNRNAVFDQLLVEVREGRIWIRKLQDWDLMRAHMLDLKRSSATLRNGEFTSSWVKSSKGNDHYFHSLAYLYIASRMRGIASGSLGSGMMGVQTFRQKQVLSPEDIRREQFERMGRRR